MMQDHDIRVTLASVSIALTNVESEMERVERLTILNYLKKPFQGLWMPGARGFLVPEIRGFMRPISVTTIYPQECGCLVSRKVGKADCHLSFN